MSPYQLVFGKTRHLPVELEQKAYWTTHMLNFDIRIVGEKRIFQLNKLDEFRLEAYEIQSYTKRKTKR